MSFYSIKLSTKKTVYFLIFIINLWFCGTWLMVTRDCKQTTYYSMSNIFITEQFNRVIDVMQNKQGKCWINFYFRTYICLPLIYQYVLRIINSFFYPLVNINTAVLFYDFVYRKQSNVLDPIFTLSPP